MRWIMMFAVMLALPTVVFSTEETSKTDSTETEVRVSRGLRYSVPKDWPMDERNGGISPVPTEEYMLLKFKKIDERLAALEKQLSLKVSPEVSKAPEKKSAAGASLFKSFETKPTPIEGEDKDNEKVA